MARRLLPLIALACLLGSANCRALNQAAAAASAATDAVPPPAAAPAAAAADSTPAAKPTAAPGTTADTAAPKAGSTEPPSTAWQKDGYVPLPKSVGQSAAQDVSAAAPPAKAPDALPPANTFGAFTTDGGSSSSTANQDPTGTASVFADPKAAPAAVQAAYAAENPTPESVLPSSSSSSSTVTAPTVIAPIGPTAATTGPGALGGDVPLGAASGGAAVGGMTDSVFANQGNEFNNRYVPSVGSAVSSNDVLVKMIINAPEQQVAASGDALRAMLGGLTNTPVDKIFVYQTRTITNANGQPSLALQLLFKNSNDAERARVQSTFVNRDMMQGLIADVAKRLRLQIVPGTIQASNAVNDAAAVPAGLPGSLPGAAPGIVPGAVGSTSGLMPGAFGVNGTTAAQPAAAPPANAAGRRLVVNAVMPVALLVAAIAVL